MRGSSSSSLACLRKSPLDARRPVPDRIPRAASAEEVERSARAQPPAASHGEACDKKKPTHLVEILWSSWWCSAAARSFWFWRMEAAGASAPDIGRTSEVLRRPRRDARVRPEGASAGLVTTVLPLLVDAVEKPMATASEPFSTLANNWAEVGLDASVELQRADR
jgi:hypothetical protein